MDEPVSRPPGSPPTGSPRSAAELSVGSPSLPPTDSSSALTKQIVIDLQERGVAAPSSTILGGRTVIRAAIVNHRTTEADIDEFVDELVESARRVVVAK